MAGLSKDESEDLASRADLRADFERMRENSSARADRTSFEAHIHWLDEVNAGLGHPKRKSEPIVGAIWIL